jgi:hypothetical protein
METIMRAMLLIAALATAMLFDVHGSHAYYNEGPWCAVQNKGSGSMSENCTMRTFEQCRMEVIAGNRGFCKPNARWRGSYAGPVEQPRRKRRARR